MTQWCPEQELEQLLQALEQEILNAEDEELKQALMVAGLSVGETRRQVSGIVGSALAEYEDPQVEPLQVLADCAAEHRSRRPR